jgi:predicted ATPase
MKFQSIRVKNFKSLVNFELKLADFTCLIGLNGSGKSTVLQLFDFLSQQMHGKITQWLEKRHWTASDLNSRLVNQHNIEFIIHCLLPGGKQLEWSASFNRSKLHCTKEKIIEDGILLLKVEDGYLSLSSNETKELKKTLIQFDYQGSVLSQLKEDRLHPTLLSLKSFVSKVVALDLLSPELLRQRTRDALGRIGLGGENIAAFLHELDESKRKLILTQLKKIYPQLQNINIKPLRSGWKQLGFEESFGLHRLHTEARHINDGLLRILAIFAQLHTQQGIVLLDEIENGINPELIEFLVDTLVEQPEQIIVTTHSPMILNFIEDEVARKGVIYLYKSENGATESIPFFKIPSMNEKLNFMGPGEAYEDTSLVRLNEEILDYKTQDSNR